MEYQRGFAPLVRAEAITQMALAFTQDRSDPARPFRDFRLTLGSWEGEDFSRRLTFATDGLQVLFAVARGEVDVASVNPSAYLTMAYRGTGPFPEPLALRALAVIPSWDRMAFAVSERTGLTSIAQIGERKYPLKVSVRADPLNSTRFVVDEVLGAAGFSLKDIEVWGGSIEEVNSPSHPDRMRGIADGSLEAVFDEGITGWAQPALDRGLQFLTLDEAALKRFDALGWPVGPIPAELFPGVRDSVVGASFSGWPLYGRADMSEQMAYRLVAALEAVQSYVDWGRDKPSGFADFCTDADATPLGIPLHPGAERYYRERGYL